MAVSGRYRGLMVRRSMCFIVVQVTIKIERETSLAGKLSQQGGEPCRKAELTGSGWIINKVSFGRFQDGTETENSHQVVTQVFRVKAWAL